MEFFNNSLLSILLFPTELTIHEISACMSISISFELSPIAMVLKIFDYLTAYNMMTSKFILLPLVKLDISDKTSRL